MCLSTVYSKWLKKRKHLQDISIVITKLRHTHQQFPKFDEKGLSYHLRSEDLSNQTGTVMKRFSLKDASPTLQHCTTLLFSILESYFVWVPLKTVSLSWALAAMKSYSCLEHSQMHAVDFFHCTAVLDLLMHHVHRRPINCLCNESFGRFRIFGPHCCNLTAPATLNAVNCDLNPSYDAYRTVWHNNINVTEECHR